MCSGSVPCHNTSVVPAPPALPLSIVPASVVVVPSVISFGVLVMLRCPPSPKYRLMHQEGIQVLQFALNVAILQGHMCLFNKASYLRCGLVSPPVAVVLVAFISIIMERTRLLW